MPKAEKILFYKNNKIKYLYINVKKGTSSYIRKCKKVKGIVIENFSEREVVIDNMENLEHFYSGNNNCKSLKVTNCNKLKLLDFTGAKELQRLHWDDNPGVQIFASNSKLFPVYK